ncbi:hypothetical protein DFH11DRAFT_1507120 [Phellopilus nigrolimitatus]|nr:hypothetical protein DFH11DRAFT_1507120 [Phellopilus nigrolimitatus]
MAPTTKKALSSKENTLFKELLNLYETRQLKKGVKTADHILKKFPDHGGRRRTNFGTIATDKTAFV